MTTLEEVFIKANGEDKPDLICIQETWLKPCLDFVITGYVGVRKDRADSTGGGCAVLIKTGVQQAYATQQMLTMRYTTSDTVLTTFFWNHPDLSTTNKK